MAASSFVVVVVCGGIAEPGSSAISGLGAGAMQGGDKAGAEAGLWFVAAVVGRVW